MRGRVARWQAGQTDGIVAIDPPELADTVIAHCAWAQQIFRGRL